jgi:hypothetical protein
MEYIIETNYGYGWEIESSYDTEEDMNKDLPEYQALTQHYGGQCRVRRVVIICE